jgi:hypothetical protein
MKMTVMDRRKITDEIISRVKSVPVGVDWRMIRIRQKSIRFENAVQVKSKS